MTIQLESGESLNKYCERNGVSYGAVKHQYKKHGLEYALEYVEFLKLKRDKGMSRNERVTISVGDVFGMLTVIEELPRERDKSGRLHAVYKVSCECGNTKVVRKERLISKKQPLRACGCMRGRNGAKYDDLYEIAKKDNVPKSSVRAIAHKEGYDIALQYIERYKKCRATSLEILAEEVFGLTLYNKTVDVGSHGRRPDFKFSDTVYVDVDGLMYHSVDRKGYTYHSDKREEYEKAGLRLLQFHAPELASKPEVVKSIIQNVIGANSRKIYARKCEVKQVNREEASIFLEYNHLMGDYKAAKCYGLYFQGELVSIMTVAKSGEGVDVKRFCNKTYTSVVGGLSKLLKHVIRVYNPKFVLNYVDLRYGTGKHLLGMGFVLEAVHVGFFWTNGADKFPRQYLIDRNSKKSQDEIAKERKIYKVGDAGQAKYVLYL